MIYVALHLELEFDEIDCGGISWSTSVNAGCIYSSLPPKQHHQHHIQPSPTPYLLRSSSSTHSLRIRSPDNPFLAAPVGKMPELFFDPPPRVCTFGK